MDCSHAIPTIAHDLQKDLQRLRVLTTCRGIQFLTVDLPRLAKCLDTALSGGTYYLEGLPGQAPVSARVQIPKLFRGLYLRIFQENGVLKNDPDSESIFFLRQLLLLGKKYLVSGPEHLNAKAIEEFKAIDREIMLSHESDSPSTQENSYVDDVRKVRRIARIIFDDLGHTLGRYDPSEWPFKHGPGVTSNIGRFEDKYIFGTWSNQLDAIYSFSDFAFHNWSAWASETARHEDTLEVLPSKLYCVPKSAVAARTICAEPAANMWCQQNLLAFVYTRSRKTWLSKYVSFNDQTPNQTYAFLGSRDDTYSTVDLSSASDRITVGHVRQLFRTNGRVLAACLASRSPSTQLPDGEIIPLRKYASMGNATIFPIQTLFFLGIGLATLCLRKPLNQRPWRDMEGRIRVFGDDIVISRECGKLLCDVLESYGLKVNQQKTFIDGPFKESCGKDYFAGLDVTPVYLKEPLQKHRPTSLAAYTDLHNNLLKRGLFTAAREVASLLPSRLREYRVPVGSGTFGLQSYVRAPDHRKKRWNSSLQRWETLSMVVTSHTKAIPIKGINQALLKFFTEFTGQYPWLVGVRQKPVLQLRRRWIPD